MTERLTWLIMKNENNHWLALVFFAAIFLFGSHLRIESVTETAVMYPLRADSDAGCYFTYAYNLRFNGIYSKDFMALLQPERPVQPDALRNPGYPLFISLFVNRTPSGKNIFNILFAQAILSSFTLIIAFYAFRGFLSKFWSLASAFLTAISPHLIVANSYVLTETLFCFFLVLTIAMARWFAERPSVFRAIMIGICTGSGFLVRPSLLYFPIFILLFLCFHYRRKQILLYFAGILVGFMLLVSPWYIRNLVTLNTLSDQGLKIAFLHHGIYPDFIYNGDKNSFGFPYKYDPRSDEISQSTATVLNEIANRFQRRPVEHIMWFVFKKPLALWSWDMVQGQGDAFVHLVSSTPYQNNGLFHMTHRLARALHWPIVCLAFMGLWISWFKGQPFGCNIPKMMVLRFVSVLLIYYTLLHMVGTPFPRYAVPLRPLLYAMAMFTLSYCFGIIRNRIRR